MVSGRLYYIYHLEHCKKSRDVKEPAGHIRPEIGVQSESYFVAAECALLRAYCFDTDSYVVLSSMKSCHGLVIEHSST